MKTYCRNYLPVLAVTLGLALNASAQPAQQGHDAAAQKTQASERKMMMPSLTEEQFVEMMTKHHQDGIALSKAEESNGSHAEVKALAAKIRESQERELAELKKHGEAAGHGAHHPAPGEKPVTGEKPEARPRGTTGGDTPEAMLEKHQQMMEQMAKASLAKVENASGEAADHAFVHEMAMHHEMALQMIAKTTFKDPELRQLSQRMATDQKKDLEHLKRLQKTLK